MPPVMTSVCSTSEYGTIVHSDARFDPKDIFIIMLRMQRLFLVCCQGNKWLIKHICNELGIELYEIIMLI